MKNEETISTAHIEPFRSSRRQMSTSSHSANSFCSSGSGSSSDSQTNCELEAMADNFQKELKKQNMIKEQSMFMKSIPKAFSGKDAVDILQKVTSCSSTTREEALEKGNEMMTKFRFFQHATTSNKLLQDSTNDFYQFECNLPSQVRQVKRLYKSHWDKVRLLEQHIECKDRRHMFRVFPNCFVAKDAVDVMMDLQLVKSRREAVHLMKRLNQKVFCCEHVTREHDFKDEYLFFEFVPLRERMPEKKKSSKSRSPGPSKKTKKRRDKRAKKQLVDASNTSNTESTAELDSGHFEQLEEILAQPAVVAATWKRESTHQSRADTIRDRLANHKAEIKMRQDKGNNKMP